MKNNKKIAVIQSNYIPWKGYFDIINYVDEFILFDETQYTRRDWRNRNKIKTPQGLLWITIPVKVKGKFKQLIKDVQVDGLAWRKTHWKSLVINYGKAKYFNKYKETFQALYMDSSEINLSNINYNFILAICKILGITTKMSWSMDYPLVEGKTERIIDLCLQTEANEYISGPSAKSYLDEQLFQEAKIKLSYMDYSGYPEYNQQYPPFDHYVSIIDLLFNEGPNTPKFMKSFSDL